MKITTLWEIGADLNLVQIWINNKQGLDPNVGPAKFGPMAGPIAEVSATHWACLVSGHTGPIQIQPECSLLEGLMDKIRSYPKFELRDKIWSYPTV